MPVILYALSIILIVVVYSLILGGWRDVLDFLDELEERRERKRNRKK